MSEKRLDEHQAQEQFEKKPLPPSAKIKNTAFSFEVEVDSTPQPLRRLRPFFSMELRIPAELFGPARDVMFLLFDCFDKAGHVSEGLIGDIAWGFSQPILDKRTGKLGAVDPAKTIMGLVELQQLGYIQFQAKDGAYVDISSDKIESAFVRYTPKLLDLVYEGA